MSKIELRLSNVDPPLPDPPRTIYRDIVNLPDPVKLGLTIRYFNHDDVALYFQITGSAPGYTFATVNLGSLASGANAYRNLDGFASRAKPSASDLPNGEMEENITLILKAYTDSNYTNLRWTYERVVTVHWINSADPAFTVEVLNNFDDGTTQGWSYTHSTDGYPGSYAVATDYVLSAPYSLKGTKGGLGDVVAVMWQRFYKSFTTPNKSVIYAIIDIRNAVWGGAAMQKNLILRDATLLIQLGDADGAMVTDKWVRVVVPLPANTTVEVRIEQYVRHLGGGADRGGYLWLDDFKIISK